MWSTPVGETFDHEGPALTVKGSPALPKPVQRPRPPIVIGGGGPKRTPRLAARYGDEYNLPFSPVERFVEQRDRVRSACEAIDRDPDSIVMSAALVVCCAQDEATLARRAGRLNREIDELRENGAAGLPAEVVESVKAYADVGATRIYLQFQDLEDLEQIELLGEQVLPALGEL